MNTETIFSSYRPIDRYLQLVAMASGEKPNPPVTIRGIDAFLMRQVAACHPVAPSVIDLAGDATLGVSTLFWAAQGEKIQDLVSGRANWQPSAPEWTGWVGEAVTMLGLSKENLSFPEDPLDSPEGWRAVAARLKGLSPLLVTVAPLGDNPRDVEERLRWLTGLRGNVVVLLLPVGPTGASPLTEGALRVCATGSPLQFVLLREVSPFFAASELGLICRRDNSSIPATLARLRVLYDGNFSYVALMEARYQAYTAALNPQSHTLQLLPDAPPLPTVTSEAAASGQPHPSALAGRLLSLGARLLGRPREKPRVEYQISYLKCTLPSPLKVNTTYRGKLHFRNNSKTTWVSSPDSPAIFNISYHWWLPGGELLVQSGERSHLPERIEPGETVIANFRVATPCQPGDYVLELDLVHEGVAWFSLIGNPGLKLALNVKP